MGTVGRRELRRNKKEKKKKRGTKLIHEHANLESYLKQLQQKGGFELTLLVVQNMIQESRLA